MNYESIKALARETGQRVTDLIVLTEKYDPFYCGTRGDLEKAEWFAKLWHTYGATGHIRRIHYKILNVVEKPDGELYRNTKSDWRYLNDSSRYARYLGLIDAEEFTDQRNALPIFNGSWDTEGKEPKQRYEQYDWDAPELQSGKMWEPDTEISGYGYNAADQPYILEIWIEKSTMADELLPICRNYSATYVEGTGYTSITRLIDLLRRSEETGKPIRVFYISDLDRAGQNMPIQAARHLQFWSSKLAPRVDIRLAPLVLTREQQAKYNFTTDEDGIRVELDAMAVERPGLFEEIVTEALAMYHDDDIKDNLAEAEAEAMYASNEVLESALAPYRQEMDELKKRMRAVVDRHIGFAEDVAPIISEMRRLEEMVSEAVAEAETAAGCMIPGRPISGHEAEDNRDWLYDSGRDYEEETVYLLNFKKS